MPLTILRMGPASKSRQYKKLVYYGWQRNEERIYHHSMVPYWQEGFAGMEANRLSYLVNILPGQENGAIGLRFKMKKGESAVLCLKTRADNL